jgi:L-iditol 2-dehydrogenase
VPADPPAPGASRLRPTAVGLCGSDLHWFQEAAIGAARLDRPLVLGHEFIGVVEDGPRAGQRVAVDPAEPCGECVTCRAGDGHLCPAVRFAGHSDTDGGLRTEMTWPDRLLHPIPDGVDDDAAVLLEPLGIALHALDLSGARGGQRAGVFGCGPIGLVLIRLLAASGIAVAIATDRREHRLAAARSSGAASARLVEDGTSTHDDPTIDVAFEASGEDAALEDAMRAVRPGGTVAIVGIPSGARTSFVADLARRKELTLVMCRRMRATDLQRAIDLVASTRLDLGGLVTDRYALVDTTAAFERAATRDGLKVVIRLGDPVQTSPRRTE